MAYDKIIPNKALILINYFLISNFINNSSRWVAERFNY